MDDCCARKSCEIATLALKADQRRVLLVVLAINLVMFFVEFSAGIIAQSTALQAVR